MLENVTLKKSDLTVTRLCMGGCPLGQYGWGSVNRADLIDAVHAALDIGVNFFDTADVYGLGESERTLGEALGARRHEAVITSKYGVRVDNEKGTFYDNSDVWSEKAVIASLKRLGTDYIDLYLVHYRDGSTSIEELVNTANRLKKKGLIRNFGFSNVFKHDLEEIRPYKEHFVAVQDEYSLARRDNEDDLVTLAEMLDLSPLTWGSLGQGILTGKYDVSSVFGPDDRRSRDIYINFHGDKLKKNLQIVDVMRSISKKTGKSLPAIAARYILDTIPGSVVLIGIKNRKQLEDNVQALGWQLEQDDIDTLKGISS